MSRKKRYVRISTAAQREALEEGYRNGKTHDFRLRCHCLLLSAQGRSIPELKEFFEVSHLSIYNWFNRFESEGIDGLKIRSGRGRKRKLDIDSKDHITLVKKGLSKENRSVQQLRQDLANNHQIEVCDSTLRNFLKDLVTDIDDSDSASNPSRIQGRWVKE